jgi:hypothetical protein
MTSMRRFRYARVVSTTHECVEIDTDSGTLDRIGPSCPVFAHFNASKKDPVH